MKARAVALARKIPTIQTHEHDHLVRNGPHRLQGADREGAAAMTEATAVDREGLRQHLKHHRCLQVELAGFGTSAPFLQSGQPALSFPLPGSTVAKEVLEQTLQLLDPHPTGLRATQLSDPTSQPVQQGPPASQPVRIQVLLKRCNTSGCQTPLIRKHQTKQPAIQTPAKAVGWIAAPLISIKAPTESTALQGGCQQCALLRRQSLLPLNSRIGQEPLEAAGRQASASKLKQIQHGHRQPRTALLAAIGEAPGKIHPRRTAVVEHRRQQWCSPIDLRGHHQHIPGLKLRICRQPLQDAITHELHFPPGTGCGLKQQRLIVLAAVQRGRLILGMRWFSLRQLGLQLLEQCRLTVLSRGDPDAIGKQIPRAHLTELGLTGSLQQLLKLRPHPAQGGLHPGSLLQPSSVRRFQPASSELKTPSAAALPEITTGSEQVDLHIHPSRECLDQLHLHRGQSTDAEQPEATWQILPAHPSLPQPLHRFTHLQTEGLAREHLSQAAPEERLPVLLRPEIAMAPGRQDVGSIQGIVVEGIGDRAGQLPAVATQSFHRRLPSLQPALQRNRLRFPEQSRKLVQHGPDESSGPPGIVFLGRQLQHQTHQLTQPTARERKAHQRADAVGCSKLFPQPATGGPRVHHHLDRFHRPGTVLLELTGQQRSEKLSAIAAVKRQQWVTSPARTLGTRSGSSGDGNEDASVDPRT